MFLTGLIQSPAMGDLLCYARVSTLEQASRLQADALKSNGCYRVFPHWASVALDECPELAKLFDQMRPGDTVGAWTGLGQYTSGTASLIATLLPSLR